MEFYLVGSFYIFYPCTFLVRKLLGDSSGLDEQTTDYKSLAKALFEAVNDKNLALSHQRRANK